MLVQVRTPYIQVHAGQLHHQVASFPQEEQDMDFARVGPTKSTYWWATKTLVLLFCTASTNLVK